FSDWRWPCLHAYGTPRISEIDAFYILDMTGQQSSWWSRVSGTGKVGFDKAWNLVDKLGAPVNKLSNKLGSEAFWPTTLDKESDKAARILRSFCKDGFYQEETTTATTDGPKAKQRVLKHIPPEVRLS
ncbi:hypothetical protein KCU79_g20449, partial [Aureobasidium melanogenum]